jgi:hypothetical protein
VSTALNPEETWVFDARGFIVRRGVLGRRELRAAHQQIDALRLPPPGHDIMSQRFSGLIDHGGLLRDLMNHPAVLDVARELCGPQVRLDHSYGIIMAPRSVGLGLHGGGHPFDPSQYYLVRNGRIHCGLVAAQWALVDHRPGDGGFACIPGTHKGRFPMPGHITMDHELVIDVPMDAGDVVIFSEALIHATRPWRSTEQRRTLLYKYSPGSSSWESRPPCRAETLDSLTPQQRRLCQPPSVAYHESV